MEGPSDGPSRILPVEQGTDTMARSAGVPVATTIAPALGGRPAPGDAAALADAVTRPLGRQTILRLDEIKTDGVLTGQYPTGLIDWGRSEWRVGSGGSTVPSSGLSPAGESGSFTFVEPHYLVSVQAHNFGDQTAHLTLWCDSRDAKGVSLSAGQVGTIETNWTRACSTVTLELNDAPQTTLGNVVIYDR
jgi:hypothetical protein